MHENWRWLELAFAVKFSAWPPSRHLWLFYGVYTEQAWVVARRSTWRSGVVGDSGSLAGLLAGRNQIATMVPASGLHLPPGWFRWQRPDSRDRSLLWTLPRLHLPPPFSPGTVEPAASSPLHDWRTSPMLDLNRCPLIPTTSELLIFFSLLWAFPLPPFNFYRLRIIRS
jgi:hypothetical protein